MLSWLDKFFNQVRGSIGSAVSNAIHYAVHALAAVVFSVFGLVGKAWNGFVSAVQRFHQYLDSFAQEVINFAAYIVKVAIPKVIKWATSELAKLSAALAQVYADIARWVDNLIGRIAVAVNDVINWVTNNVLTPLSDLVRQLRSDLEKWGYTAWYYITHPDQLAELLINSIVTSLEAHAWDIGKRLGQFILALLSSNLSRILQLIEDILTAVI